MQVKKQQNWTWNKGLVQKLGKEYVKSCILSPCLFNLQPEYIMQNTRLHESQAESKIALININNLRHADDTTLMAKSKEKLMSFLIKEREKGGLKLNIQQTKMASSPITSWQIDGEKWKLADFIFLVSKITASGDSSHKIKRHLLLGRKSMTNLDVLKNTAITCPKKVYIVKAMAFPVVMYRCDFMDHKEG